jgi:hypothetical protein
LAIDFEKILVNVLQGAQSLAKMVKIYFVISRGVAKEVFYGRIDRFASLICPYSTVCWIIWWVIRPWMSLIWVPYKEEINKVPRGGDTLARVVIST